MAIERPGTGRVGRGDEGRSLSDSLRREAKQKERLADIADALGAGGMEVGGFSPLSAWEVQVGEDDDGNPTAMPLDEYVRRFN